MNPFLLPLRRLCLVLALIGFLPSGASASLGRDILEENDPYAALNLLEQKDLQRQAQASDPAGFEKIFARALELKDLYDLLISGPDDSRAMRQGLSIRTGCAFCQNPVELLNWTDRYFKLKKEPRYHSLRQAVWDWSELPLERQDWLATKGESADSWATRGFPFRRMLLRQWALTERDLLMKSNPSTKAEVDRMRDRIFDMDDILSGDESRDVWRRFDQAEIFVEHIDAARKALIKKNDDKSRRLLADLDAASDIETRISLLSQAFDGSDPRSQAVRAQAPSKPGQVFNPQNREMTAGLLATGLMREIAGTWAGDELAEFYTKAPLIVKVDQSDGGALAWYQNGVITFNEAEIERYVRSQNSSVENLSSAALLQPLLRELSSVFVHEATHHRQQVWAKEQKIPDRGGHGVESEAMQVEALFVLEKMKRDPTYRDFLETTKTRSINSRSALSLANRLQESGPEWFRRSVMSSYYPGYHSIEANVWLGMEWYNGIRLEIEAELKRREGLSPQERAALDTAAEPEGNHSREEISELIKTIGTKALQKHLQEILDFNASAPQMYAAYTERLAQSDAQTLERLKMLESGKRPGRRLSSIWSRFRQKEEPPSPVGE